MPGYLKRCLFAVSSRFVQRVSLIVNIDLSDVTNRYNTVLYPMVVVYEKKNRSLVFSGSRKIPTLGPPVWWETWQASFPTGTVGPLVGIFLSPLNTNDGFYLSPKLSTMSRHYMWLHMLAAVTHVRLNIRPEFFYLLIYKPSFCNFPESRKK